MKKRLIYVVLLGLCLTSISAFSYPASAQKISANHCVQQITSVPRGQHNSKRLSFACYNTFSEAIAVATGGRVHLSSAIRPQDLTQAMLPAYIPNTPNVIGIDWKDANFQGQDLITDTNHDGGEGDRGPCGGATYYAINVPRWFNDVDSSAKSYYNCDLGYHWENTNYSGALFVCEISCNITGVMNDQTSSIEWFSM